MNDYSLGSANPERYWRVRNHPSSNFVELVRVAGLNPSRDFRHLNMSRADFADCDLAGFDFTGSDLRGASFVGAHIEGVRFRDALLEGAIFEQWQYRLPEIVGAKDFAVIFGPLPSHIAEMDHEQRRQRMFSACQANDTDEMRCLVASGIGIDEEISFSDSGTTRTPLIHFATRNHFLYGNRAPEAAEWLLKAGANPNLSIGPDQYTALLEASHHGDQRLMNLLLTYRADPNLANDEGRTPLHAAVMSKSLEAVRLLLNAGADPNRRMQYPWKDDGETPLDIARGGGHHKIAKLLKKYSI